MALQIQEITLEVKDGEVQELQCCGLQRCLKGQWQCPGASERDGSRDSGGAQ